MTDPDKPPVSGPAWIDTLPVDTLRHQLTAALAELHRVEETLAYALGYPRSEGGPDDPNGGGYVLGDHTAVSLAAEVATVLGRGGWVATSGDLREGDERLNAVKAALESGATWVTPVPECPTQNHAHPAHEVLSPDGPATPCPGLGFDFPSGRHAL